MIPSPRRVPFIRGFYWISEGFQLVFQSPFGWMKVITLWFGFTLLCGVIIAIGPILFSLMLPILFGGLMVGCRAIENGQSMNAAHLFAGFRHKPARLITLGGVNVLGEVILTTILLIWGGQRMIELQTLSMDGTGNLEQLQLLVSDLTPMFITLALIQAVLLMLGWFAPALLVFSDMTTSRALSLSGKACLINTLPFLAYSVGMGALLMGLITAAFAVPVLGVLLFIMGIPTLIAAVYVSYRDIFSAP
ncbi:MAG: BPSS1780 family membrane protein [Burkholderiales bacterium]